MELKRRHQSAPASALASAGLGFVIVMLFRALSSEVWSRGWPQLLGWRLGGTSLPALRDEHPVMVDFTSLTIVCSWCLKYSCDVVLTPPELHWTANSWYSPPGRPVVLYVRSADLATFYRQTSRRIDDPFVLVTGDSDSGVVSGPDGHLTPDEFGELMSNPRLVRLFAQNAEVRHPKLVTMPIGMDYHSLTYSPQQRPQVNSWRAPGEHRQLSMSEQERSLFDIKATAPAFEERSARVLFPRLSDNSDFRVQVKRAVRSNSGDVVVINDTVIDRPTFWRNVTLHRFVASPRSRGLDCHRTWEILALGSIPLVSAGPHNDIFRRHNLPILEVGDDEWASLAAVVERGRHLAPPARADPLSPALTNRYWVARFRGELTAP